MHQLQMDKLPHTVELVEISGDLVFRSIDQRLLPDELKLCETSDWRLVVDAIKTLAVRGAPAIGLAGASALALASASAQDSAAFATAAHVISEARPTAVNLSWAVKRAVEHVEGLKGSQRTHELYKLVKQMEEEDEQRNRAIGAHGASLLGSNTRVLTHCNAGSLATFFYGTALGVVYAAAAEGKIARVYADETRPVGQGARLTAWELSCVGIPTTVICDNMAASLMAQGSVDAVLVGADRIARNGDTANKIGTYSLAILAHHHHIPFYVAAPTSTIDASLEQGGLIPIEQRSASEVLPQPLQGVNVWNPAFDVTPARYITAIITEDGVFAPSEQSV